MPQDLNISPDYEDLPTTLIIDGRVIDENLTRIGRDINWLQKELKSLKVTSTRDVFFASLDAHGQLYYQLKSSAQNQS